MPIRAFGGVVGVEITRRAGHVNSGPAGQNSHATYQVDCRDDRAFQVMYSENFGMLGALPCPHSQMAFAGSLPASDACLVDGCH